MVGASVDDWEGLAPDMDRAEEGTPVRPLEQRTSRRGFLKACAAITAALALPAAYVPRVAAAVATAPRLPAIWLRGLGCGGDTEAFLRAAEPTTAQLLLDLLSVEHHDAIMAGSGVVTENVDTATERYPEGYLLVVEGAVPTAQDGVHLTVGGRPFGELLRDISRGALATIALGSCAFDGGLPAAARGVTGATGVGGFVPADRLISLPGCPVNVDNLTATIVHYLTFGELPPTDRCGRPLFAYGALIHNECGRRPHFEFGEFVHAWGDEGAQKGWCLYRMGCKGPETFANCASVRYGSGASWPVRAGAPCIGCATPGFWDAMSPFSRRLPSPIAMAPDLTVDQVGQAAVAGVAALVAAHAGASVVRARVNRIRAERAAQRDRAEAAGAAAGLTPASAPAPSPGWAPQREARAPEPQAWHVDGPPPPGWAPEPPAWPVDGQPPSAWAPEPPEWASEPPAWSADPPAWSAEPPAWSAEPPARALYAPSPPWAPEYLEWAPEPPAWPLDYPAPPAWIPEPPTPMVDAPSPGWGPGGPTLAHSGQPEPLRQGPTPAGPGTEVP